MLDACSANSPPCPEDREHSQQAGKSRPKPSGPLAYSEQVKAGYHHPIKQRWFFKPGVATQGGGNEIATQEHFPRYLGVARFIGSHKRHMTKTVIVESYDGEK